VSIIGVIVRFVVSALVLLLLGFLLPGFEIVGFLNALIAAAAIAAIGWGVEALLGRSVSPRNRGVVGFLTAAGVIWGVQFLVPAMSVSLLGALLASAVIGVVDVFVPTELR